MSHFQLAIFLGMTVALGPLALLFLLAGALPLLPLILAYTAYNYWVFRGKTRPDAGYH